MHSFRFPRRLAALLLTLSLMISLCVPAQAGTFDNKVSYYSPYTDQNYMVPKDAPIIHGIDVSSHQSEIDWREVAEDGIEFAIIRVAYRGYGTGRLVEDSRAIENIEGALSAGIAVGLYVFSQATNEEEAIEEAQALIDVAKDYNITLPLVFDLEFASSEKDGYFGRQYEVYETFETAEEKQNWLLSLCRAFCQEVHKAGYPPMIYSFRSLLETLSGVDEEAVLGVPTVYWMANYNTNTSYAGNCDFWQYASTGKVEGISTNVDCNFCFVESWMDNKPEPDPLPSPDETTPPGETTPPSETTPPGETTPPEESEPPVELPDPDTSELKITPKSYPTGNITAAPFNLEGTITSNYELTYVSGSIRRADGKVEKSVTTPTSGKTFAIMNSVIDNSLPFGSLESGYYYLQYTATDLSGHEVMWKSDIFAVADRTLFTDVEDPDLWYYTPIYHLASINVINGFADPDGSYYFSPNDTLTRIQTVALLYNLAGAPEVTGTHPFTDAPMDWYKNALTWAYQNKVVSGRDATSFDPNASISRQELATVLFRFFEGSNTEWVLGDYQDVSQVQVYAQDAMNWCVSNGVISSISTSQKLLAPGDKATRGQAAKMLMTTLALEG